MLIRITDSCDMGCSHCMVEASPNGDHMFMEGEQVSIRCYREFIEDLENIFPKKEEK